MNNFTLPVRQLSYSAIRLLLTNPAMFKKRYIEYQWDDTKSPSLVEGSAFHAVIAQFYRMKKDGKESEFNPINEIEIAVKQEIRDHEDKIDWGITGSLEKSIKTVENCVTYYLNDAKIHTPHMVEESYNSTIYEGEKSLPLNLKGRFDLIAVDDSGEMYGVDHKTVSSFSDEDEIKPEYQIQAVVCYLIMKNAQNIELKHVQFDEVKKSVKPVKTGNVQSVIVKIDDTLIKNFMILYKRIVNHLYVMTKINPLPNIFDFLDGKETWEDFQKECEFINKI